MDGFSDRGSIPLISIEKRKKPCRCRAFSFGRIKKQDFFEKALFLSLIQLPPERKSPVVFSDTSLFFLRLLYRQF